MCLSSHSPIIEGCHGNQNEIVRYFRAGVVRSLRCKVPRQEDPPVQDSSFIQKFSCHLPHVSNTNLTNYLYLKYSTLHRNITLFILHAYKSPCIFIVNFFFFFLHESHMKQSNKHKKDVLRNEKKHKNLST